MHGGCYDLVMAIRYLVGACRGRFWPLASVQVVSETYVRRI